VVLVLTLKAIVTGVLLRLMGARRGIAIETGILMASPSETTLIVLAAATSALLIQPGTAQFWQIVTAIGLTITPLLAKLGSLLARQVEPAVEHGHVVSETGEPPAIIVGCGRVGPARGADADRHGQPYVAIDSDSEAIARCKREGYHAVFANASRLDVLDRLGVAKAPAVILTMDEPVLAQRITRTLRAAYPELPIIARARDSAHAAELYRAGASTAVPETLEASLQLSEAVLVDLGVPMGPVIASIHEKRDEFRRADPRGRRARLQAQAADERGGNLTKRGPRSAAKALIAREELSHAQRQPAERNPEQAAAADRRGIRLDQGPPARRGRLQGPQRHATGQRTRAERARVADAVRRPAAP
jgi:CPA2 family monovalent cation:H+ antiporter-2